MYKRELEGGIFLIMRVLALNCGSSSVKSALIDTAQESRLQEIHVESVGADLAAAVDELLAKYRRVVASMAPEAVVHRVVHGGEKFREPIRLNDGVLDEIEQLNHLAPLHNPPALAAIRRAMAALPDVPHFAVFDTAFHSTLPERAREYALPLDIRQRFGIRRFGFHGINHEHVAHSVAAHLQADVKKLRVISCHLGNGASVTAIEGGRSVDTSMGMTPLEGLVMGTRAGDVDPGVLLQLRREGHLDADELDDLLNKRSGLKGLAGTNDMRDIERRASAGDASCVLAIDIFVHRVRKYIGAYAAGLGGVDAIAFTAGVGEHNAMIRRRCSERLEFMGAVFDGASNDRVKLAGEQPVAAFNAAGSRVHLLAVRADEELSMARAIAAALAEVSAE